MRQLTGSSLFQALPWSLLEVHLSFLIHLLLGRRGHECWMARTLLARLTDIPQCLALIRTMLQLVDWW